MASYYGGGNGYGNGGSSLWDYLAYMDPGPQSIGDWGINNALGAFQNYGNQLNGAMNGVFATNALNSQNVQNLQNAQAQTAQGFYNAAGNTNSAISGGNALMEQARQQAASAQAVAQQQYQSQLQQAQLRAEADKEIARMQAEAAASQSNNQRNTLLDLERLKQEGTVNRIGGLMPLLNGVLGGIGGGGGLGGITTNYGAGTQFTPSTQPSNAQAYRPRAIAPPVPQWHNGGLLGQMQQPQRQQRFK